MKHGLRIVSFDWHEAAVLTFSGLSISLSSAFARLKHGSVLGAPVAALIECCSIGSQSRRYYQNNAAVLVETMLREDHKGFRVQSIRSGAPEV